jgi:MFS family permease
MALRQEVAAVYGGGVVQGIVLVAFPAIGPILTGSHSIYALSSTEYGTMFVPQAILAVVGSLLGAGLTRLIGGKSVLLIGLVADLLSMLLLYGSQFMVAQHGVAFGMLLGATTCLGIGFGFAVPALNTFTAAFFPEKVDQAILTLNALLGLGTALAPVFASILVGLGLWWGLPLLMSVLTAALILFTIRLPLRDTPARAVDPGAPLKARAKLPARFWLYAAFALLYGVCESLNGNWGTIFMSTALTASVTTASLALTVFWAVVTGGRVLFAAIGKWCPEHVVFRALPVLIAVAFVVTSLVPKDQPMLGLVSFGLAGLGCSALLPLVISFCQGEFTALSTAMAGAMIGLYQAGYGAAAFGVGPLESAGGLDLVQIYRAASALAALLAVVAFIIIAGRPKVARV